MFSAKSLAVATLFSLIGSSSANPKFDLDSHSNVAMYWGQGTDQRTLAAFCEEEAVDIIPIGFVNSFTAQANGWAGDNFGNGCWPPPDYPYYVAPGYNGVNDPSHNLLHSRCPYVQEGVTVCQEKEKKVVLSLGGAYVSGPGYGLTGAAEGEAFAEFLWGAYGPYTDEWFNAGKPRPLDRGLFNTSNQHFDIDGFDFDIELPSTDNGEGYIACINHLRYLMNRDNPGKKYLITGAPQCFLPDSNMSDIIKAVAFDILFVQFYNNPSCSAGNVDGFNFLEWIKPENLGASSKAKIFIGLEGSQVKLNFPEDYLDTTSAKAMVDKIASNSSHYDHLGGIMIWEATSAFNNIMPDTTNTTYYQAIKSVLLSAKTSTSSSSTVSSTTTSSSSSTSSSVSTTSSSSSVSTSSSSSSSVTSTSATATPTGACAPVSLGCYTEAGAVSTHRTLEGAAFPLFDPANGQTVEKCAANCAGYTYFGVEYGGECYCGNQILAPAAPADEKDCNIVCLGDSSETCGGSNRLNLYQSGGSCSSTSTSASVTSTTSSSSTSSSESSTITSDSSTSTSDSSTSTSESSTSTFSSYSSTSSDSSTVTSDSSTSTSDYSTSTTDSSSSSTITSDSSTSTSDSSTSSYATETSSSSTVTSDSSVSSTDSATSSSVTNTSDSSTSESSTVTSDSSSSTYGSSTTTSATSTSESSSSSTSSYPTFTPPYGNSTRTSSTSSTTLTDTSSSYSFSSVSTPSPTSSNGGDVTSSYPSSILTSEPTTSNGGYETSYPGSVLTSEPTSSSGGYETSYPGSVSTSESVTEYTTSTVYTTKVYTTTSCAPTVTNCPAGPHEVTVTIPWYTTVCPVTATETTPPAGPYGSGGEVTSYPAGLSYGSGGEVATPYTTSTVYTTHVYTVTSCAPTVTNCPVGQVTTEVISLYTTVCPVAGETGTPVSVPLPPFSGVPASLPAGEDQTTSTLSSTTTSYVTIKVIQSTVAVVPIPKYPTPVKIYTPPVGTGTSVPSGFTYSPVYGKPTSAAGAVYTPPAGAVASTPASYTAASVGSKTGFSSFVILAMILALII